MALKEIPKTAAEVTPEMIEAWKKKFPKGVYQVKVEDQEIGEEEITDPEFPARKQTRKIYSYKSGFIRKPTRDDLKYAMTKVKTGGELAMVEAMLGEIWLGGDEEILTDDDYFFGACMQLQELVQFKNADLAKL